MDFYNSGSIKDLFAPRINVTNILLDNSTVSNDTTQVNTNSILVDLIIQSKQNNIDQWISDVDYLQYTQLNFIVFQSRLQEAKFKTAMQQKDYLYKSINDIILELTKPKETVNTRNKNINVTPDLGPYSISDIAGITGLQEDNKIKLNTITPDLGPYSISDVAGITGLTPFTEQRQINASDLVIASSLTQEVAPDIKIKTVFLKDIINLEGTSIRDYTFKTNYSFLFNELEDKKDIIFCIVPIIDFKAYFADNRINNTVATDIINQIYNVETHTYNILINNQIINDKTSSKILNDVRELKSLKNNLLSLLPQIINTTLISDQKRSYLSDIFTSYDYSSRKLTNYFFFKIKNFLKDNCIFPQLLDFSNKNEINLILNKNKCINFDVYRNNDSQKVTSFYASYDRPKGISEQQMFTPVNQINASRFSDLKATKTLSAASPTKTSTAPSSGIDLLQIEVGTVQPNLPADFSNPRIVSELSNNEIICLAFDDTFTDSAIANIDYSLKINYQDAFVDKYYKISNNTTSGLYFKVLNYSSKIQSIIDDPRNTDSKTTKFNLRIANNEQIRSLNNKFIRDFFELYNLFTNKNINDNKIEKIIKSLDFSKTTLIVFNDFLSYVNKCLIQFNTFFETYSYKNFSYSKTSGPITVNKTDYFFEKDDTNTKIKNYCEYKYPQVYRYDLESSPIDSTNIVTYKIINAVSNLVDGLISYSDTYSLINTFLEAKGTTIEISSVASTENKKTKSLFKNTQTINDSILRPAISTTNSNKQIANSVNTIEKQKITNIIKNIDITNQLDYLTILNFELNFLSTITDDYMIPTIKTLVFDTSKFQWIEVEKINNVAAKTYLAKTSYSKRNDIFNSTNTVPPISKNLFITTIESTGIPALEEIQLSNTPSLNTVERSASFLSTQTRSGILSNVSPTSGLQTETVKTQVQRIRPNGNKTPSNLGE
jgi:hypothetical protein